MGELRTKETAKRYKDDIAAGLLAGECVICKKAPVQEFKYWKIVHNDYPYDAAFSQHDMIVPLRHANIDGVLPEEWQELNEIKRTYINEHYEWTMESTIRRLSIPAHFHMHLVNSPD